MNFKSQCDILINIFLICDVAAFADNTCVVDFDISSKEKAVIYLGNLCQCLGYNDATFFFNNDLDLNLLDIRFNSEGALQITHLKKICSNIEQSRAPAETDETNEFKQSNSEIPEFQATHEILYDLNYTTTEKDAKPNIVTMTTESSILNSDRASDKTIVISTTLFDIVVPNHLTQINNILTQSDKPKQEPSSTSMLESLTSYKTEDLFTTNPYFIENSESTTNNYDETRIDPNLLGRASSTLINEKQHTNNSPYLVETTQLTLMDILNAKYLVQTVSPEVESSTYFSTETTMAKDTGGLSKTDYLTTEDASTSSTSNEIFFPEMPINYSFSRTNKIISTELPINDMSSTLNEIISPEMAIYNTSSRSNEIISTELPLNGMSSTLNEIISPEMAIYDTSSYLEETTQLTLIDILNAKYLVQTVSPEVESSTYFSTETTMAKNTGGLSKTEYLTTEDASTFLDTSSKSNEKFIPEMPINDSFSRTNKIISTELPINGMSSTLIEIISPEMAIYNTSSSSNEIISTELPINGMSSTLNEIICTDIPMPENLPTPQKLKTKIAITEKNTKDIIGLSTASYLPTSTPQKDTSSTSTETPMYEMLSTPQPQEIKIQNASTLKDNAFENILVANPSTTDMSPITDDSNLRVRHSTNEPTPMSTISNEITIKPNVTSFTTPSEAYKRKKCAESIRNDQSHLNVINIFRKCF